MPGKVLIADDSLKIQKELTKILEEAGVEVAAVSNGEHAVRQLPTVKPDLVLADIFMPVRTGYEVCEYIKSNPDFAQTAVVLLVSKMEPFDEAEAQRVGADGKVDKPFGDPAEVLATIQEHLKRVLGETAPPPIDEFAAAVPAAEEEPAAAVPEPEPEPEVYATAPEQVTFEEGSAPQGFTEMLEETPPAEEAAAPAEAEPAEVEEESDLGQGTVVTSADELRRRIEAEGAGEEAPPVAEAEPVEEAPAAEIAESFAETVSEEAPAEAVVETVGDEVEESMDLSSATILTSADELKRRIEAEREVQEGTATFEPAEEAEPVAEEAEAEIVATQQEESVGADTVIIEKPELAEAWEMTGPQEGAPEIAPAGGEGWDSQWKDTGEEAAVVEEAPVEEAPVEEEAPAEAAVEGFAPGEFAAGFGGEAAEAEEVAEAPSGVEEDAVLAEELAQQLPGGPSPVEEAPAEEAVGVEEDAEVAEELAEALPGGEAVPLDPALVDEVVNQVLERLSPEVMETIAREIVGPLAEALLREKLRD